jgi:superfamily II DNA or RNA helicase
MKRENQVSTRVDVVKYSCGQYDHPPPVNRRGDVCFTSIVTLLANDDARTRLVAGHAARLATQHRDVLVLSHRREHCKALAEAIFELGIPSVATYLGGDKSVPETQVIVATYSLTSEGFDLPRLNALVLATPASDVEQSCGRVMRGSSTSSSTRGAIIVDVVDQWGVCFAQAAKRRALYKRSGFMFDNANNDDKQQQTSFAFVDDE